MSSMSSMSFEGKVALITGGGSGRKLCGAHLCAPVQVRELLRTQPATWRDGRLEVQCHLHRPPVRLPRSRIDRFEGRLEYWDAATETAWICEPTTPYHERPSRCRALW